MKKLFSILVVATLLLTLVVSAQQNNDNQAAGEDDSHPELIATMEPGQGNQPEHTNINSSSGQGQKVENELDTQNMGEDQQLMIQERQQLMAQQKEDVKQQILQQKQAMQQELTQMKSKEQNVLKNQNQVRLAVHALLEMKDLVGGIGPQVSEIAKSYNNSIKETIQAEEKIQTRSALSRFFAGGDKKAAEDLEAQVAQNQERVMELKQLQQQCECDEEVKAMMQEQIQSMEQEQTRLRELADNEKKSKGLFGWLWK
jgi:hypothetical protein